MRWKIFHTSRELIKDVYDVTIEAEEGLIFFQNAMDVTEGQESLRDFAATFVAPTVAGNVKADCDIFVSQDFVTIHESAHQFHLVRFGCYS